VTPELFITRHNPLVDPALGVWGWEIAVYLFLGGWVAGMMIITGYFFLSGRHLNRPSVVSVLPGVGLGLLSLGMLALFLDLEHKLYVWRLYTTVQLTSPMSWGAWILLLVYPVLAASWTVRPPDLLADAVPAVDRAGRWIRSRPGVVGALGAANVGLGVALGIYTGILLSSLGARPLWSSGLLGLLFLASGVSAAAAFAHMAARSPVERRLLVRFDIMALAAELGLVSLFLFGLLSGSAAQIGAARLLVGGPYTAPFWVLVVGIGIIVPFLLQTLAIGHRIRHTAVVPVLVLVGSLALRFVFVYAGQASHWARGTTALGGF
jgi:protein NrfD